MIKRPIAAILQVADTIYKPIEGFPNYLIGSDGSVWSKSKNAQARCLVKMKGWSRLKQRSDKDGYQKVQLCRAGYVSPPQSVHVLVLKNFIGPRPRGMLACHNDGNPANNNLTNLRWDTPSGNCADKRKHGTLQTGARNGNCRLSDADIRKILEMKSGPYGSQIKAARMFGISRDWVWKIWNGAIKREVGVNHG